MINRIKNPETIAEHIFRAAIMGWMLGRKKESLDTGSLIKTALAHDLCEVYAGDITPYDSVLPDSEEELRKLMRTWPRFSSSQKEKNNNKKHLKEKASLRKLTSILSSRPFKGELMEHWMDYEKRITSEGKFFNQADRMENFLQAYEYWEKYKKPPLEPWWIWAREFFDDPLLLEFMEILELRFHRREIPEELESSYSMVRFFNRICDLKRKPRRGWVIHEIEGAETTAEHLYHTSLLTWILGSERKDINLEKALKIALVHDICEVCAPDFTSYDAASLSENKKITEEEIGNIRPIKKRPTKKQREKMELIKKEMKNEAIDNVVKGLSSDIGKEVRDLWKEYQEEKGVEGVFVRQCNQAINLFQGMEYHRKYDRIDRKLWIKRAKEVIDDPQVLEFVKVMEKDEK